jgi:hypothetical protein
MARGVITKMSYWNISFILPNGGAAGEKVVPFRWSDVRGMTTDEQFRVGQSVEYDPGRDRQLGTRKANNVRPVAS